MAAHSLPSMGLAPEKICSKSTPSLYPWLQGVTRDEVEFELDTKRITFRNVWLIIYLKQLGYT